MPCVVAGPQWAPGPLGLLCPRLLCPHLLCLRKRDVMPPGAGGRARATQARPVIMSVKRVGGAGGSVGGSRVVYSWRVGLRFDVEGVSVVCSFVSLVVLCVFHLLRFVCLRLNVGLSFHRRQFLPPVVALAVSWGLSCKPVSNRSVGRSVLCRLHARTYGSTAPSTRLRGSPATTMAHAESTFDRVRRRSHACAGR